MKIDKESALLGWIGYSSMLLVPQDMYNDELELKIAVILATISWVTLCFLATSKVSCDRDYWTFTKGGYYIWLIVATFGAILSLARIT